MGRKKPELPSSDKHLLSVDYVDTPFGGACKKMEIVCIRCGKLHVVTAPDNAINIIKNEKLIGTAIVEYIMDEAGWVHQTVKRKDGKESFYMICPNCVEKDFEAFKSLKWWTK